MPTADPIRVFQLLSEGRVEQAAHLAGALGAATTGGPLSASESEVTSRLIASFLEVVIAGSPSDEASLPRALAFIDEADAAGRPAWAAAGRAKAVQIMIESGHPADALPILARAEYDLASERAYPRPLDPPGGPTGPGAAANNLGVVYVELGLFGRAEPHLMEAARASAEEYGPDYAGQACIDQLNLLAFRFAWAIDLEADDDPRAREQARVGLAAAPSVISRAQGLDWPVLADFARVLEFGLLSLAQPDNVPVTAPHTVRAILHTSPEGSLLRGSGPLLVLARLCRLVGDADGASHAADTLVSSAYGPHDPCLSAAFREAMLASVPADSAAVGYGRALRNQVRRQRAELEQALDICIQKVGLELRHADVRAAREHLERALDAAGAQEARLREAAEIDPLTGLLNRASLLDRLAHAVEAPHDARRRLVVAFIDLDGFKAVNDRRGHVVGDRLLAAVAAGLRSAMRESDVLARYGGDEFVCLRQSGADQGDLEAWAGRLRGSIEDAASGVDPTNRVSASIGLCVVDDARGMNPTDLIARADAAMYEAKGMGAGSVHVVHVPDVQTLG